MDELAITEVHSGDVNAVRRDLVGVTPRASRQRLAACCDPDRQAVAFRPDDGQVAGAELLLEQARRPEHTLLGFGPPADLLQLERVKRGVLAKVFPPHHPRLKAVPWGEILTSHGAGVAFVGDEERFDAIHAEPPRDVPASARLIPRYDHAAHLLEDDRCADRDRVLDSGQLEPLGERGLGQAFRDRCHRVKRPQDFGGPRPLVGHPR